MHTERKTFAFEMKGIDAEKRQITGYGNVKNVVDLGGDIVVDGAYGDLKRLVEEGWGACSHNWGESPIGMILEATEDAHGLLFTMQYHTSDDGEEAWTVAKERIAAGKKVFFSIGYWVTDSAWETRGNEECRILKKIEVVEISQVNMAMNPLSTATGIKSGMPLSQQFEALLAGVKDFSGRLAWIKEERKRGLKGQNLERGAALLSELKTAMDEMEGLLADPPAEATAEEIEYLELAKSMGLVAQTS